MGAAADVVVVQVELTAIQGQVPIPLAEDAPVSLTATPVAMLIPSDAVAAVNSDC